MTTNCPRDAARFRIGSLRDTSEEDMNSQHLNREPGRWKKGRISKAMQREADAGSSDGGFREVAAFVELPEVVQGAPLMANSLCAEL